MSKFGSLISQAKGQLIDDVGSLKDATSSKGKSDKSGSNKTGKPENQIIEEKSVNLSIKVPEYLRRHWVAEAKRKGTSITAEVMEALNKKFGMP